MLVVMQNTISAPRQTVPAVEANAPALAVRNLTKRYGAHTVVDDLTFEVPRGGVVGLIGPNGAGKTTVMKMMLGLVTPTSGALDILGTSVGTRGWGNVLTQVGAMVEAPPLYDRMTARQNLRYQALALGQTVDDRRIEEILLLVGLNDRADDQPRRFSLGMRQRLGIGISLVGDPELIILDEPANGLDPAGIREIRSLCKRLPELGATVLVSSHQLAEVEAACDSVVILRGGALVANGTTDSILASREDPPFQVIFRAEDHAAGATALVNMGLDVDDAADDEPGLLVRSANGLLSGHDLAKGLGSLGLFAESLSPRSLSLEDAFLELTDGETGD